MIVFKPYYTKDEARELVFGKAVSSTAFYTMIRRGDIPKINYGRQVYVPGWWVKEQMEKGLRKKEKENE